MRVLEFLGVLLVQQVAYRFFLPPAIAPWWPLVQFLSLHCLLTLLLNRLFGERYGILGGQSGPWLPG